VRLATVLAETSKCRIRHGAILVRGGSVLSCGTNRDRNCPSVFDNSHDKSRHSSLHAEMAAIKKASTTSLVGATIYVARVNKQGLPRMSRPCNHCYVEILRAGIKEIVFTT
jgi:deoxycytidylate deaminase